MDIPCEAARNGEITFDERPIDNQFCILIRDLPAPPRLDLLAEWIEVSLNPVHPNRQRIHDGKVLRVLRKNRRELALKREITAHKDSYLSAGNHYEQEKRGTSIWRLFQ